MGSGRRILTKLSNNIRRGPGFCWTWPAEQAACHWSSPPLAMTSSGWTVRRQEVLFLCQDMTRLDLYGTIDVAVCALDSINHLTDPRRVQRGFSKVSLFLNPGGLFLFDVNSPYKHRQVLGNNTFVYDEEKVFCVWQNALEEETDTVTIRLDFFEKEEDGSYQRSGEEFRERAYSREELDRMLDAAGFQVEAIYQGDTFDPPTATSERLVYVARKIR